jgi:hypothetical protein
MQYELEKDGSPPRPENGIALNILSIHEEQRNQQLQDAAKVIGAGTTSGAVISGSLYNRQVADEWRIGPEVKSPSRIAGQFNTRLAQDVLGLNPSISANLKLSAIDPVLSKFSMTDSTRGKPFLNEKSKLERHSTIPLRPADLESPRHLKNFERIDHHQPLKNVERIDHHQLPGSKPSWFEFKKFQLPANPDHIFKSSLGTSLESIKPSLEPRLYQLTPEFKEAYESQATSRRLSQTIDDTTHLQRNAPGGLSLRPERYPSPPAPAGPIKSIMRGGLQGLAVSSANLALDHAGLALTRSFDISADSQVHRFFQPTHYESILSTSGFMIGRTMPGRIALSVSGWALGKATAEAGR